MKKQIALNVITGFLGAGKTTFLNHYITERKDKKVGVIVNEFGKVGIDGPRIETESGIDLHEINNGSIFCKCRMLEFAQALVAMQKYDLDSVVVEASGLADPANLGEIFKAVMIQSNNAFTFKGSICLVDAVNFLNLSSALPALENQVRYSHLIIINKCDLVDEERLESVREAIKVLNPYAKIQEASYGNISTLGLENIEITKTGETTNHEWNRPRTSIVIPPINLTQTSVSDYIEDIKNQAYRAKGFVTVDGEKYYLDIVGQHHTLKSTQAKQEDQMVLLTVNPDEEVEPECE